MTCPCCAGHTQWPDLFDLCDECLSDAMSGDYTHHEYIHPLSEAQKEAS